MNIQDKMFVGGQRIHTGNVLLQLRFERGKKTRQNIQHARLVIRPQFAVELQRIIHHVVRYIVLGQFQPPRFFGRKTIKIMFAVGNKKTGEFPFPITLHTTSPIPQLYFPHRTSRHAQPMQFRYCPSASGENQTIGAQTAAIRFNHHPISLATPRAHHLSLVNHRAIRSGQIGVPANTVFHPQKAAEGIVESAVIRR